MARLASARGPLPRALLAVAAVSGFGLVPAVAEAADKIPVHVISAANLPGVDNTMLNFTIESDMKNVLLADVAANDPGWGCVELRGVDPRLSTYPIELVVRVDPGPATEQYYAESVLSVQGQGTQKSPPISVFLDGRPLDQALLTGIEPQVRDLAAAFEPCQAKAELQTNLKWAQGGVSFTFASNDEINLTLQQDGSFDTESPVTSSTTVALNTPCPPPDVGDTNPRLHLAGGYSANDGSLAVQKIEYLRDAWTYASTCTIGGVTAVCSYDSSKASMGTCTMAGHSLPFNVPLPTLVGDLLGGAQLSLNLADGATLTIPPPPGVVGTWESSLQLAYPGT